MTKSAKKSTMLITCARGVAPYLKQELTDLGFPVVAETGSSVTTQGTLEDTYRLNLHLRTAQRVLFLLTEFPARDANEFARCLADLPWEEHVAEDGYLCVRSTVDNPHIRDPRYANLKCKDAIVDRLREHRGRRPDSGPLQDRTVVNVFWKEGKCSLYFDTSGEPLSRRGYRRIPLDAPLQETLAAAIVKASGWNGAGNFVNPMCGSGTLAIEAAMIALGRAPGLLRRNYGFMHIKGFNESTWQELRVAARRAARRTVEASIIATDARVEAVEAARKNARTAGVEHVIEFGVCDYSLTAVPPGGGVVVVNPEYGARMGRAGELEEVYRGLGDFFKRRCTGYRAYVFTGNLDLAKKVGLRATRRMPFFNGALECRLLEYELYEGSREKRESR